MIEQENKNDDEYSKEDEKEVEVGKNVVVKDKKKAILFINLHYFGLSLGFLLAKFLYIRHSSLEPEQIIFMRSLVGLIAHAIYLRSKIKAVVWDDMPEGCFTKLMARSI